MTDPVAQVRARYGEIHRRTARATDFPLAQLEQSRQLFELSMPNLRTRAFDVLTCLVGLPVPESLQVAFVEALDDIVRVLPRDARVYRVRPELLHWEVHVIKRPQDAAPRVPMEEIVSNFARAVEDVRAFEMTYTGFFVASDGTVCFEGLGDIAELRARLREALPCSSPRQSELGHISAARILDPVGSAAFRSLLHLRGESESVRYGVLPVREVKLVSEQRWYMEEYQLVHTAPLP